MSLLGSMLLFVGMSLAIVFGSNTVITRHLAALERTCQCPCGVIHGGWPETAEIVSSLREIGETLDPHPWFIGGVVLCLRPTEGNPVGRLQTVQRLVDRTQ